MYNVIRSIVTASRDSIKCYELGEKWWCEKKTVSGLRWELRPATYPVVRGGREVQANAVVINTASASKEIVVVEPAHRSVVAVVIDGVGVYRDEDLDKIAVLADVPFATPIRLIDLVDKVDTIVDWGY